MRARLASLVCTKKEIAHDTYHDPYNVPFKFGEDPFRNVETYCRTDTHTDIQTYIQTDTHTQTDTQTFPNL
jgi:hypothetical protein